MFISTMKITVLLTAKTFTANGLDNYSFNNDLIYMDEQNFADYFRQAEVKGVVALRLNLERFRC